MDFGWFKWPRRAEAPQAAQGIESEKREEVSEIEKREKTLESPEEAVLRSRKESSTRKIERGICGVIFVELKDDGQGIFKEEGCQRERAAYLIDRFLGLDMVPPTVIRQLRNRTGSMQKFIPDAKTGGEVGKKELLEKYRDDLMKMWILDLIIDNHDRHPANFLVKDGRIYAIDHHLILSSFDLAPDPLESPTWGYESFWDEELPVALVDKFKQFLERSNEQALLEELLGEVIGEGVAKIALQRIKNLGSVIIEQRMIPKPVKNDF